MTVLLLNEQSEHHSLSERSVVFLVNVVSVNMDHIITMLLLLGITCLCIVIIIQVSPSHVIQQLDLLDL